MMRPYRGYTLIELLVVVAIIATLAALLVPAISGKNHSSKPPETSLLHTVRHDGHLWVLSWRSHSTHFVHHPDCPCQGKQAERTH